MRKVAVQKPSKEIMRAAKELEAFGFDLRLLGSQRYVLDKLERLSDEQVEFFRDCLQRCGHPRFRKEFAVSRHVPYGNSDEYKKCICDADAKVSTTCENCWDAAADEGLLVLEK
jgi:hypothetical protein